MPTTSMNWGVTCIPIRGKPPSFVPGSVLKWGMDPKKWQSIHMANGLFTANANFGVPNFLANPYFGHSIMRTNEAMLVDLFDPVQNLSDECCGRGDCCTFSLRVKFQELLATRRVYQVSRSINFIHVVLPVVSSIVFH
jgi:hypothetical protein